MNSPYDSVSALKQEAGFEFPFRLRQSRSAKPKRCVVLLHGVGGNEMNLADLATGIDPDTLVVLPRGPISIGPDQFAWFRVAFTASGPSIVAAEAEESRRRLIHFIEQLQSAYGIDAQDTVIAGFSQGGILSASVALSAPECVDGFAILSGRILPELKPHLASRERLANLRAYIAHGDFDNTLPVVWSQRADQWLSELGVPHVTRLYPIGHEISAAMRTDFLAWLAPDRLGNEHLLRYASIRNGMPAGAPFTVLQIGDETTTIVSGKADSPEAFIALDIGARKTALAYFKHNPPTPGEMENAIMNVEDEVARVRATILGDSTLFTTDAAIREIAMLAGIASQAVMHFGLAEIETTFDRLVSVLHGRPASTEGLPTSPEFAATLLILREFMHHLKFSSITVVPGIENR